MSFSTKRGRPKKELPETDLGTIELQNKREYNQTLEPLDYIYKQNLISKDEYFAGVRLRWLYSLKFGIPLVQAYNISDVKGKAIGKINHEFDKIHQKELRLAIEILKNENAYSLVSNICIFLKFPVSLFKSNNSFDEGQIYKFKAALGVLSIFFKKAKLKKYISFHG